MRDETFTSFARYAEELSHLERVLNEADLPRHDALIVGAGLVKLRPESYELQAAELQLETKLNELQLSREYSYEYLEIAAILARQRKPWSITVVDKSPDVCESVKAQEEVIIRLPRFIASGSFFNYVEKFLSTMGGSIAPISELSDPADNFYAAKVPQSVRQAITVVCGQAKEMEALLPPGKTYDVITFLNVHIHMSFEDGRAALAGMGRLLSKEGIMISNALYSSHYDRFPVLISRSRSLQSLNSIHGVSSPAYPTAQLLSVRVFGRVIT